MLAVSGEVVQILPLQKRTLIYIYLEEFFNNLATKKKDADEEANNLDDDNSWLLRWVG